MRYEIKEVFKTPSSWMEVTSPDAFKPTEGSLKTLLEEGWEFVFKEKRCFSNRPSLREVSPQAVREVNVYVLRRETTDQ